jgi:hypothetical protein
MSERIRKNYRCLMIKTPEKRKYFTHEKNFAPLIEYSRMFQAELSVVRVREAEILDLPDLIPALCDTNYQPVTSNYRVLGVKIQNKPNRHSTRQNAQLVRDYILDNLLKGRPMSLRCLCTRFGDLGLSSTSLANQFRRVRDDLNYKGYDLGRDSGGVYNVVKGAGK